MPNVAVVIPSRGLVFSASADEIMQNVRGIPHTFYFSHKRPIPECFELPVLKALKDATVTHLWLVEDDMIIPPDTLQTMLDMDVAVVTADYPTNKNGMGAVFRDAGGKPLIMGTGCTLVKREVFDELKAPYFRTDIRWNVKNMDGYIKIAGAVTGQIEGYGLHDVNFSMNMHRLEVPIHVIDTILGQRKLVALGKAGSNDGAHTIEEWRKVKKDYLLKEIRKWPKQNMGELISVMTPSGEITVSKQHGQKLLKKGLAAKMPRAYSQIDWGSIS